MALTCPWTRALEKEGSSPAAQKVPMTANLVRGQGLLVALATRGLWLTVMINSNTTALGIAKVIP